MASKAQLENGLRNKFLSFISNVVAQEMTTDVLPVSASELAIPCKDDEGNERYVLIKVSIPRGTRDGEGGYIPYNGREANEEYLLDLECKTQERAVKKAMKDAEKGKKKKIKDEE